MASKGRDGSIWRFNIVRAAAGVVRSIVRRHRIARIPSRIFRSGSRRSAPGVWETSGIIDAVVAVRAEHMALGRAGTRPTAAPGGAR